MEQTSSQNNDKMKEKSLSLATKGEKISKKDLSRLSSALKANIARRKKAAAHNNGE